MKRLFGPNKRADSPKGRAAAVKVNGDDDIQLVRGLSNLYSPDTTDESHVRDIADVLLEMGKINGEQLEKVHQNGLKKGGNHIEQLILNAGVASADDILAAKAELYGFEFRRLEADQVDKEIFEKLDLNYIRGNHIMPIAIEGDTLVIATSEPRATLTPFATSLTRGNLPRMSMKSSAIWPKLR
ncbi:MAG: GspE/PulE/PilB domain-containing protein [Planctomycetota bacterium]|jgi:general secretion pathway protein E